MAKRFLMFALLPLVAAAQPMGTLENGVYHHNQTGIRFTLPPEWPSAEFDAQVIKLKDSVSNAIGTVWLKKMVEYLTWVDGEKSRAVSWAAYRHPGCRSFRCASTL
jgi:hypothetical protein